MVLPLYVDNSDFLLDDPEDLNWTMAYDGHILGWEFSTLEQRRNAYLTVRPERLRQIAKEIFQPHNFVGVAQGEKQRLQAIDWKELTVCLCD